MQTATHTRLFTGGVVYYSTITHHHHIGPDFLCKPVFPCNVALNQNTDELQHSNPEAGVDALLTRDSTKIQAQAVESNTTANVIQRDG